MLSWPTPYPAAANAVLELRTRQVAPLHNAATLKILNGFTDRNLPTPELDNIEEH